MLSRDHNGWTVGAAEGFYDLDPTDGWGIDLVCSVAAGIAREGETFARWVPEVDPKRFERTPDRLELLYETTLVATNASLAGFGKDDIYERGGFAILDPGEIEEYFDFEKYARAFIGGEGRILVETADSVAVFEDCPLPAPRAPIDLL